MKNELCRDIMKNMEQLKKNEIFEAEITAYNSEGSGVARILGRAVFVPRTIVGERWRIVIVKVTASAVYGRALEPVKLSPERREPECENYLRCGGCGLRHMSYAEELRFKKQRVDDALRHIAHQSVQVERITGSDETAHYRNKGIYAVREVEGRARKGFFAPRSHELVPVGRCLIQSDIADKAAEAVVRFMNDNGLRAYDEKTRSGLVKHVYVRKAVNTPDAVAVIVASGGFGARTQALVNFMRKACPELTGIVLNVNKTSGNTVLAGDFHTLWGRDYIRDSLGGIVYELAPQAFYQINPPQAEKLYKKAVEYASPEGKTVLDMYCGAGTISLFLARAAKHVIGAEIIPEAVENARENAHRNGIENADFICADASEAAEKFLRDGVRPEAIVVDPPRKGMDEAAVRALCGMAPERIVYVSCNPATLARDICVFNDCGYALRRAEAVDMFPRTAHVETVVLLEKEWRAGGVLMEWSCHIRKLRHEEVDKALSLVWKVFQEYEAPDYTEAGVEEFYKSIHDESYLSMLCLYGAFIREELVGIIATRSEGTHVALFFVDGKYHRQGIGKMLFQAARSANTTGKMTVNSSPYAVCVYHKLGFKDTDTEQVVNSLRFTPMVWNEKEVQI